MFETTVAVQITANEGWRNGLHGELVDTVAVAGSFGLVLTGVPVRSEGERAAAE